MLFKDMFLFLAVVAILFSGAESYVLFGRDHYEENFCEVILKLDQWFRRCNLKIYQFLLVAILFSGGEQFMQFW